MDLFMIVETHKRTLAWNDTQSCIDRPYTLYASRNITEVQNVGYLGPIWHIELLDKRLLSINFTLP